jgi:BirA family transcriptional regulator, biotin operon repressor / biotin---[acetyl-CoA-carboxylase] ligase
MLHFGNLDSNNILVLPTIDSTNAYTMNLISKGLAKHGMIVQAMHQTEGKGQRGNTWSSRQNENIICSIALEHEAIELEGQFILGMATALGVLDTVKHFLPNHACWIKWPNDVLINNKKVAGVLIENIVRGTVWTHSVVGIGMNVNTPYFSASLPFATSFLIETIEKHDLQEVLHVLLEKLSYYFDLVTTDEDEVLYQYKKYSYRMNEWASYFVHGKQMDAKMIDVYKTGKIKLEFDNASKEEFWHGEARMAIL